MDSSEDELMLSWASRIDDNIREGIDSHSETDVSSESTAINLSAVSDPLGISLDISTCDLNDAPNYSSSSEDPLGSSIFESNLLAASESSCVNSSEEHDGYSDFCNGATKTGISSTPKKQQTNIIDTEQISTVLASPVVTVLASPVVTSTSICKAPIHLSKGYRRRALNPSCIIQDTSNQCKCKNSCMDRFTYSEVNKMRLEFWNKDKTLRSAHMISKLKSGMKCGKFTNVFLDNGVGVCLKAFCFLYHIDRNTLARHKKLAADGYVGSVIQTRGVSNSAVATISWIEGYATLYGDRMPHTMDTLLPYKTRLRNIYKVYSQEVRCPMAESSFYRIWKTHFPFVKVKKTNSFAQCTKCASLQMMMARTSCPVERQKICKEKDLHNQRQMLERKYYYAKRESSKRNPDMYLSLIIDGMDQSKTDLPHFTGRQAKIINPSVLLKTHITGVISHGHGQFRSYIDVLEFPHDPNLTINVLSKSIMDIADKQKKLPPVLFLQADNCYRENKNRYVFAFCEYLVCLELFEEVHISFLYSGHTHEDIDAAFSKIAETLRTKEAETLDQLLDIVPNSCRLQGMLDYKSWLFPYLSKVKGTSEALHYKIKKCGQKVNVFYKGQQHTPWLCMDGLGSFLKTKPRGKPKPLKANYEKIQENKDRLKKQIQEIPFLFSDEENIKWWDNFIQNPARGTLTQTRLITSLPKQNNRCTEEVEVVISEELKKMLEKESAIPKIVCERRKNHKKSRQ